MGEYLLKQFMKILLYTYVSKKRNLTMDAKMKGTNVYTLRAYWISNIFTAGYLVNLGRIFPWRINEDSSLDGILLKMN